MPVRDWPQQHRSLAALAIIVAVAAVAAYMFLIRPKWQAVSAAQAALGEKRKVLGETGWPLDSERLNRLLEDTRKKLDGPKGKKFEDPRTAIGTKNKSNLILRQATSMFAPKIEDIYHSSRVFIEEVSRLDYEEEFNALYQRLYSEGIILAGEVLGIDETTSSRETYQLVLQVWTLGALVDLALDHRLQVAKHPTITVTTENGQQPHASDLTVLPVRAYSLSEKDTEPYVLEFPLRMTLRGDLADFCAFVRALHDEGRFYPINHVELKAAPSSRRSSADGDLTIDRIEAKVECCAFFRLDEDAPEIRIERENIIPPGI